MATPQNMAFFGTVVHSTSGCAMRITTDSTLGVENGKIVYHKEGVTESEACNLCEQFGLRVPLRVLKRGEFIMPGFVDTHIHAPQYSFMGCGYSLQLMDWLDTYTFPIESKFADTNLARDCYSKVVRRTLMNGTTTACYFATIHTDSSLILAEVMDTMGQRGLVGKVSMDRNSPDFYREETNDAIQEARRFVEIMLRDHSSRGLIGPCVTPRFAVSCSPTLLAGLAQIAKDYNLPVQTHMSENMDEVTKVLNDHAVDQYVQVYENAGLLTERTILAHCVHSGEAELSILKRYRCGIAHCPCSNIAIRSGLMDIRLIENHDVKIGLGTDVSAGYSASILDNMRKAVDVSKLLHILRSSEGSEYQSIDISDAFRLATMGGAQVLGLQDKIGNFEIGKDFDALVISPNKPDSPYDLSSLDSAEDCVHKFLYTGDDRNIIEIFVAGKKIMC